MGFDRNTVIGFVLLAFLFFGYFFFNRQGQIASEKERARIDSIAKANQPKPVIDTTAAVAQSEDSAAIAASAAVPAIAEQQTVLENEVLKISFTNKGAQPALVELKNFNSQDSVPVKLVETNGFDRISYAINLSSGGSAQTADLMFEPGTVATNADGSQTISFRYVQDQNRSIVHQYTIRPGEYMINFNVQLNGADRLLTNQSLNMVWQARAVAQEKDLHYEKQQSQVTFTEGNEFDYFSINSRTNHKFEKRIKWVSVKQQFFSQVLISDSEFEAGELNWVVPHDSTRIITEATANLQLKAPGAVANMPFRLYYGPNDYHILKKYQLDLESNVNLGQGVYAFVKYINRLLILPLFDLFKSFIGSLGIVILMLTVVIRLLISPLNYKSYLSSAKMKVLRPELEELKKKHGDDQQAYAMDQMKLFREAGVNPLGGCIPALLQIPIFFALFSFFNSSVDLRGQGFLWANDLSAYDSIFQLPFRIPWYGDHVSLFTILAVVTSFAISLYSMNMTPDQNNPMLKYMPYIFPILMLGFFNNLPSALTWYYTVSNVITLILQFVIQRFIIDHDKILAQIEVNRKKPKKQSKWQERLAEMQEAQKKVQEMKERGKK